VPRRELRNPKPITPEAPALWEKDTLRIDDYRDPREDCQIRLDMGFGVHRAKYYNSGVILRLVGSGIRFVSSRNAGVRMCPK